MHKGASHLTTDGGHAAARGGGAIDQFGETRTLAVEQVDLVGCSPNERLPAASRVARVKRG